MKLNHLHIKSSDLAKSRSFYEKYFGFRMLFEHGDDGVFLIDDANFLLAIFNYKEGDQRFPDWFHYGFCQADAQIVRDTFARMKADGVPFASELAEYGEGREAVVFYCLDPGGNKIEVGWHKEEAELYATPKAATATRS